MNRARILVVDDEPQIRRVMRAGLTVDGYFVDDARTGDEALQKLREDRFDLVLLDVNMPGMSGTETCRQIRARSDIAIIMLTVRNSEADIVMALDAGADDYVTKPFSMPELSARIRANLRRVPLTTAGGPSLLAFDGLEINVLTHQVTVGGRNVRLTPKEFDLLHYLASNPNIAIPHGKLLQTIWGPDYGNEIEYLHVFVNQIRKKIEPGSGKHRYIVTEPRLGYRFSPVPEKRES